MPVMLYITFLMGDEAFASSSLETSGSRKRWVKSTVKPMLIPSLTDEPDSGMLSGEREALGEWLALNSPVRVRVA